MLYVGCFLLWANIDLYVLSYFHQFSPEISIGFIYLVDLLLEAANCTGFNLGTYMLNGLRLPVKVVLLIGTGLSITGVYAASFTTNLAPYLSFYALLNGMGSGTTYFIPLICGWEYFPERKGLITGVVLSAFGFGSFVFGIISSMLCNPDSLDPKIEDAEQGITYFGPEVANRVPFMFRSIVKIWAVQVLIALLLITRKPRERVLAAEADRLANQA
jgi:MFS transporter, OFA family, oxalate/formate antiporter